MATERRPLGRPRKNGPETETVAVRVDPELKSRIETAARNDDRTIASFIIKAIRDKLAEVEGSQVTPPKTRKTA